MSTRLDDIRALIREGQEHWQIPGLSVAIAAPARGFWSEGFGLADRENKIPATADTVYRLASVSKPITATAVMQLAERGRLDLDAPIQRYVPAFPEKPWPITTRLLLAHLGGIRDFTDEEGRNQTHYPHDTTPLATFLDRFKNDPLLHEPGSRFRYTTHGYTLLGCIVEQASGQDYLSYIRENIFAPAGMEHTYPEDTQVTLPHRARGYDRRGEGGSIRPADFTDTSDHLPGGGFCATASDVVRFGTALLDGRLVKPETRQQIFTRQRTRTGQDTRFGLGWFLFSRHGQTEAAHGGKHYGASTMLYLLAESGIVVGLLTNLQGVASPYLHKWTQHLADLVRQA